MIYKSTMHYSLKVSEKCLFYLNILYIKKVFDSTVFVFIILSSILYTNSVCQDKQENWDIDRFCLLLDG